VGGVLDGNDWNIFVGKPDNLVTDFGFFGVLGLELKNRNERKNKGTNDLWIIGTFIDKNGGF